MPSTISLSTLKLHNERLNKMLADMQSYFGAPPPKPGDTIEEIMYKAGQQSVLDYFQQQLEEN